MNKFEEKILKWDFKKITKIYIIALAVVILASIASFCYVFRSRISFANAYSKINDSLEDSSITAVEPQLKSLAASSGDVTDIIVLDSKDNVIYSAKNSSFSKKTSKLSKAGEDHDYLKSSSYPGVVFKYLDSDEFISNNFFTEDYSEYEHDFRSENFYDHKTSSEKVYMLSFIGDEEDSSNRIYIISKPTAVSGGDLTVKLISTAGILMLAIYWVLLAIWACSNALRSKLYAPLWGIIVLLTNIAGVIVYEIYKHANTTCPNCGASQSRLHRFCTYCGTGLGETCKKCGALIGKNDSFCGSCGAKKEKK